jgi:hypothetical protein
VLPSNIPATAEAVRNHTAVANARVEVALAKAYHIRTYADSERLKFYERAVNLEMSMREQQRRAAHEVLLLSAGATDTMRKMAEDTYKGQMERSLPRIDVRQVLDQLHRDLPGLEELNIPPATTPPTPEMPSPRRGTIPLEARTPSQAPAPLGDPVGSLSQAPSLW